VKIAEDRVSKFAGDIVSNLLALGHARVGDLVQAYGIGNGKITNKSSHSVSVSDKRSANGSEAKADSNGADDITLDKIHETLDELLSFGLVSEVNISHFRSDADNRIEAEKVVPPVEHYKAKSKRENEAQWELSVVKKLVDWKNGLENETIQVNGMNRGKKRTREDVEGFKPEKRQRLDRFDDNDVTGATYQIGAAEGGFLDVRVGNLSAVHRRLTFCRTLPFFGSTISNSLSL